MKWPWQRREPKTHLGTPFDVYDVPVVGYCSKCGDVREAFYTCRDGGHTVAKTGERA